MGQSELSAQNVRPPSGHDPTYMFYQGLDGIPRLNGVSSFEPPAYRTLLDSVQQFPDSSSLDLIRSLGARWLLIHGNRYPAEEWERLQKALDPPPGLVLEKKWGPVWLFRVE